MRALSLATGGLVGGAAAIVTSGFLGADYSAPLPAPVYGEAVAIVSDTSAVAFRSAPLLESTTDEQSPTCIRVGASVGADVAEWTTVGVTDETLTIADIVLLADVV